MLRRGAAPDGGMRERPTFREVLRGVTVSRVSQAAKIDKTNNYYSKDKRSHFEYANKIVHGPVSLALVGEAVLASISPDCDDMALGRGFLWGPGCPLALCRRRCGR